MGRGQVQNDGAGASVKDPLTGLEILSKPPKCEKVAKWTEDAFGRRFFTNRNQLNINVILYYGLIHRVNHKGKRYQRMLVITRNYVLVAYAGGRVANLRHGDAIVCRCIPITSIDEAVMISREKKPMIGLRVNCKISVQFDLLFIPDKPSDVEPILNILQKCYSTLVPTKKLKCIQERDKSWPELKLDLKKPDRWKLVTDPDALPVLSAMDLIKAQNQQKQREVKIVTLKESSSGTVMKKTPEAKPLEMPTHNLPPIPKLATIKEQDVPVDESQVLSQSELETAQFLKKQLEELRHQSELLSKQQEMQLASLDASQKIVSLVVNDRNRKKQQSPPQHINLELVSDNDDDEEDIFGSSESELSSQPIPSPRPPTLPLRSPSTPNLAVTRLQQELQSIRKDFTDELTSKDNQIEALRLAIVGMINEDEKLDKELDEESAASVESDDEKLTESEIEALTGEPIVGYDDDDDDIFSSPEHRDFDIGRVNSEADSDTGRLAETHAKSIQTRRKEVEQLLQHLAHVEMSSSQNPADISSLRSQLQSVLHDLEIEALSYQEGFTSGLPVTQQIEPLPHPIRQPPLASDPTSLFGGVVGQQHQPQQYAGYGYNQSQQQQQDAYWQWANYYNYLSQSGYGNESSFGQQPQHSYPSGGYRDHQNQSVGRHHKGRVRRGSDEAAASEDSDPHPMWDKWRSGR